MTSATYSSLLNLLFTTVANVWRLVELAKLCFWFLKTDYTPLETFRRELESVIFAGVVGIIGFSTDEEEDIEVTTPSIRKVIYLYFKRRIRGQNSLDEEKYYDCEVVKEQPLEERIIPSITSQLAVGRRSTRRNVRPPQEYN